MSARIAWTLFVVLQLASLACLAWYATRPPPRVIIRDNKFYDCTPGVIIEFQGTMTSTVVIDANVYQNSKPNGYYWKEPTNRSPAP